MSDVQINGGKVTPEMLKGLSPQQIADLIEKFRQEGLRRTTLTVKHSAEKGAVSVYGLNARFPVSLYAAQWEKLAEFLPKVLAYIKEHPELPRK